MLLLLSGLAATVAYTARVEAVLTRRGLDLAEAQAAADAAIVHVIANLTEEHPTSRPTLNVPENWQFDGVAVALTVSNEAGRIDINAASDSLLNAFLRSQGAEETETARLVQQLRSFQGEGTPRPRPLETPEELQDIPGWSAQNLTDWSRSLTTYTGAADVIATEATPGALAALDWLRDHPAPGETPLAYDSTGASNKRSLLGEVLRVEAIASVGETHGRSEWIGRVTGNPAQPVLTLRWRHGV